jgi:uncharacterized phage protein gp47/JayE
MADRKIYTALEIANTIITKIGSLSSKLTDFTPGSNLRAIVDSVVHYTEFQQLRINKAIEAFKFSGAFDEDLDNRVGDYGMRRKPGTASTGPVTFIRNTPNPATFTIYAGSQISTQPDVFGNTIDFNLQNDLSFPSGATYVTGMVTCATTGVIGNVASGTITNITSTIPGVDSASNPEAFVDGANVETNDQLKARVPLYIQGLKQGNEAAIRAAALSVPGIVLSKAERTAAGQVTAYVSSQSGVLSSSQLTQVKNAIETAAAFGMEANVVTPTVSYITITMDITYNPNNFSKDIINSGIKSTIYDFILNGSDTTIQIDDLIVLAKGVNGVDKIKNVKINGVADDYTVTGFAVAKLADQDSSITINWIEAT